MVTKSKILIGLALLSEIHNSYSVSSLRRVTGPYEESQPSTVYGDTSARIITHIPSDRNNYCRLSWAAYEIMINAIFELFFTPFNEELLKEDLNRLVLTSDSTADMQDEIARQRIMHPLGHYFEVLKKNTDNKGNGGFWKNDK